MAIKRKRPTDSKPSAVKEFTDRTEPRKAFWSRYAKMVEEGSTIITFYGAGGVGKTALLKKIEDEIKHRDIVSNSECKYVKYDFSISTDPHEVLKTLKFQLAAYGCPFPLFDAGNYYYSLKIGQDITPPKAKSMLEKIPWLNEIKSRLEKADSLAGKATPLLNTAKTFFSATDEVLKTFPVMKTITTCFSIVDALLVKYMEFNEVLDDDHREIRCQMNSRFQEKNPVALHEYLPTLFAQDAADWMAATGNKLVVFLDNYEMLVSATTLATEEQLKRDLWLRGDDGLIFMVPDTLWTIAGRNKIRWDGELADELDQHLIKALSPEDSDWFLQRAGIADENLRGELVKLTEGYPIFLDLCVDVYVEYKRRHEDEPTIDEFGQKRQDVVARIFRYLDADKDDAAKDMLEFLCVLNVWTDELAADIGGRAIHNFSRNTYKRVKNFSFIQEEHAEHEDFNLTIFRFDKTIQSLLIAECDAKLLADVKGAVDEHFKKFFADDKNFDARKIFYLKLWAEFTVRFADDAENLRAQFDALLKDTVDDLTDFAKYNEAEEILSLFMSKLETFGRKDTVPYAAFEVQMSCLRQSQAKYVDAYEFAKTAYEKISRALGEKDFDTINAKENLATTLDGLARFDDALTLREKVLSLRTEILGEKDIYTVNAMHNLAVTLDCLGRWNEALALQEKILSLRKEIDGDEHPDTVAAMNNLAVTLCELGRIDDALSLQEKILSLRKKILGDEHFDTLGAMYNLANSLDDLGRHEEALTLNEKVLSTMTELLGDKHPATITAMQGLAITLENLERYDESLPLKEKIFELRKEILGDKHPDTLRAMGNAAWALGKLKRFDEALEMQRTVLSLSKELFGEKHPDVLLAMMNLAWTLSELNRHEEVLPLREKILSLSKELFGDEHPDAMYAAYSMSLTLNKLNRHDDALTLLQDTLARCREILGDEHALTEMCTEALSKMTSTD